MDIKGSLGSRQWKNSGAQIITPKQKQMFIFKCNVGLESLSTLLI